MKKRLFSVLLCGIFLLLAAGSSFAADSFTAAFDISGDGKVNSTDARALLRVSAKLEQVQPTPDAIALGVAVFGDCNGDGKVNSTDARMLLRYAARLIGEQDFVLRLNQASTQDSELVDDTTKPAPATTQEPPTVSQTDVPPVTQTDSPVYAGVNPQNLPKNTLLSPYYDHGLGKTPMILTSANYAEVTPSGLNNLLSNTLTTPYIKGTVDYAVSGPTTVSGSSKKLYPLASGVKIEADDITYLPQGYRMPDNAVQLLSVLVREHQTELHLKTQWQVPVLIRPETYANYSGRDFTQTFSASYIELSFYNTASGSGSLSFPKGSVFSSASWSTKSATKVTTLRLMLAQPGGMYGCIVTMTDNGYFKIIAKNRGNGLAGKTVVLDPGHGGVDGGGGSNGVYEAPINLQTALYLRTMLEKAGASVVMTREDNSTVTLDERVQKTRDCNADIFISLHCDVAETSSANGVSVYYYYPWSKPYAQSLQDGLTQAYRTQVYAPDSPNYGSIDRNVRFYAFQVARSENCPAVLIELGFLTNSLERQKLQQADTQKALAQGILNGLQNYYS